MKYPPSPWGLYTLFFLLNFLALNLLAQEKKYTVSGTIKDAESGEALIGASIMISGTTKGAVTNAYGYYSLTLPEGSVTLKAYYIGYAEKETNIDLRQDMKLNITLQTKAIETQEVVISGDLTKNTESTEIGKIDLDIEQIKQVPAFMGEIDLIKTIQLLPGVMTAGEGNSGLYVRGGGPDQNMILVDDANVYNVAHLLGFFSIFNADAVKNVELIKGGMPAQYGGRLASVLDIHLKEGNAKKFQADGGIGLIASRLTLQGPIIKDKCSFIVSGRRTYVDVVTKPFIPKTSNAYGSGYYFYDLNGKINYHFSEKDQVYLSGYYGEDVFSFVDRDSDIDFRIPYGNATATARWNHLFSEKLFASTTASYSRYNFQFASSFDQFRFSLFSGIQDYSLKSTMSYYPSLAQSIKFGAVFIRHKFSPGIASFDLGDARFATGDDENIFAHESGVFFSDEFDLGPLLKVTAGLRYSHFTQVGPFKRYIKDETGERVKDIVTYDKWEKVIAYGGLEPRLSVRYKTGVDHSVKAAFTRNLQYLQMVSISPLSLPTDIWIPSSQRLKPQLGYQYNIGYFRNFSNNQYETSVELYYKNMLNLVEYAEGASPDDNLNDNVDNNLVTGTGYSYGAEFFVKRVFGKLNGWIGYTWSRTRRKFPDIDQGAVFPAKYDRMHDLNVAANYDLNRFFSFGLVFIYASGNTITLPLARYYSFEDGRFIDVYGPRNSFRMRPYHRLDLSITYKPSPTRKVTDPETGETRERKKRIQSSWNLSVYNAYNRKNPYFLYNSIEGQAETSRIYLKQVSLFPVLPGITWNFSF